MQFKRFIAHTNSDRHFISFELDHIASSDNNWCIMSCRISNFLRLNIKAKEYTIHTIFTPVS